MRPTFHLPPPESTILRDGMLALRPLVPDDAESLCRAGQAEDIGLYTSIEWPFTLEAACRLIAYATNSWHNATAARFAILEHVPLTGTVFVGAASLLHIYPERLDAEVGYWLSIEGRGRGIARRAVGLLCDWAFGSLRLRRLHLGVDIPNSASHAVARSNCFSPTVEEMWRHPTDPSKDAIVLMYERHAPSSAP
jgi:RimJ/RimL family protein N-acetyltransferase